MMRDASGLSAAQGLGMSDLWRVYVDEAGDRGSSDASSGHFVVAAVIVRDQHDGTARRFVRDNGDGRAIVTFAHVRRFKSQKLHEYREALRGADTGIHWPSFADHPFRINAPDRVELLQMADTVASAIYRAVEPDQFGNAERRYLDELLPKVYRRGAGPVTSYGLKVFPSAECASEGTLNWLSTL
jgi:hypothetical protein